MKTGRVAGAATERVAGDSLGNFDFAAFADTLSALEDYVDRVIDYGTADGVDAWIEDEVADARLVPR